MRYEVRTFPSLNSLREGVTITTDTMACIVNGRKAYLLDVVYITACVCLSQLTKGHLMQQYMHMRVVLGSTDRSKLIAEGCQTRCS